jgi:hypothetical protein
MLTWFTELQASSASIVVRCRWPHGLLLLAFASAVGSAAEPPPLVLFSTVAKAPPDTGIVVLLARTGGAKGRAVILRGPTGSAMWAAPEDGNCNGLPASARATLQVPATAPDSLPFCFSNSLAGVSVQLVATTADAQPPLTGVSTPIQLAQSPRTAFWSNPAVTTLLSAAVGFVFGLASSWFQTWYDAWKQNRVIRRDAQKFIADSLFPELRKNGELLSGYLTATPEERKAKSIIKLSAPKITEGLGAERLVKLSEYFTVISKLELTQTLRNYDRDLTSFNRMADRLSSFRVEERDTAEQMLVAKRLHSYLSTMYIA